MKIAIVTDAWRPQTNGVVTTLTRTAGCLTAFGHDVTMMTPENLWTIPCPTYPEIRLALFQGRHVARWLEHEIAPVLAAYEAEKAAQRQRDEEAAERRRDRFCRHQRQALDGIAGRADHD